MAGRKDSIWESTRIFSEFVLHGWYNWIWYHNPSSSEKSDYGRWLGPIHDVTQGLAYHILTKNGEVVVRSTVHKLTTNEDAIPEENGRKSDFMKKIEEEIGNYDEPTVKDTNTMDGSIDSRIGWGSIHSNNLWRCAIEKEMRNVIVAFKLLQDDKHLPIGSKEIPYHIIFDVIFDLTRKARLVRGGYRNRQVLDHLVYSTVVSHCSVRLSFM